MLRGALVGFVLMLVSQGALAEPSTADRKRAGELASESGKHYKRGEFEVSVALLRKAYALYPEPNLLYNLARSLEGMGDKRGAIDAYNRYLSTAKQVEDRGALQRRVALLERELADKQRREVELEEKRRRGEPEPAKPIAAPEPANVAPIAPPEPASPPLDAPLADPFGPPERVTPPSKLPWIPIGIGVASIGAGVGFGLSARNLEARAVDEPVADEAQKLHASAVDNARVANVLFVAGGAVLVGGIVWEIVVLRRQSRKSDAVTVRPMATANGIALEWTWP